ncbi:MAG TPA: HEAT repeat domain-containing protein [Polyangiaceae bacterium]|nr:HEAT repeat domain-containing protein [Polyangiaceae bacterium]
MDKSPSTTWLERLRDPGFTPRLREVDALVDLLADEDLAKTAVRAIGRVGPAALGPLRSRLEAAGAPLRAHIVMAIGRFVPDPSAVAVLLAALEDADPKTRRNAAIALGHVARADVEDALIVTWDRDPRPPMRRTLAASLGKVGSGRSLPLLREAAGSDDPELARIASRARAMVERTASRGVGGRVDPARSPLRPVDLVAFCRRGLEDLLADELTGVAAVVETRALGPGRVRARLAGSIDALFAARTMLWFAFPLPTEVRRVGEPLTETIARAATSEAARGVFATWTEGPIRYRIAWSEGGHQRAAIWDASRAIEALAPDLVNDPTASTWEIVVARDERAVDLEISPRSLVDPRFKWRRGDVPAASHPTLAAALARVAGVREDDVVWDPFVGSGAELVERALLGPTRALFGSDIDSRALAVARDNLAAAGVEARLEPQDALGPAPQGVTLIVTNPPMGRRASRAAGLDERLDRFVAHAAASLAPRGRLVWMAPWPKRARIAAQQAGLTLDWASAVDMGGFDAELQRWVK